MILPAASRLSRIVSPLGLAVLRLHTRLTGTARARVALRNQQGEILLIKDMIGTGRWQLPGGAIKKHEEPAAGAARELAEETGIELPAGQLTSLGSLAKGQSGASYHAYLFTTTIDTRQVVLRYSHEITDFQWCEPANLPPNTSPLAQWAAARLL